MVLSLRFCAALTLLLGLGSTVPAAGEAAPTSHPGHVAPAAGILRIAGSGSGGVGPVPPSAPRCPAAAAGCGLGGGDLTVSATGRVHHDLVA